MRERRPNEQLNEGLLEGIAGCWRSQHCKRPSVPEFYNLNFRVTLRSRSEL